MTRIIAVAILLALSQRGVIAEDAPAKPPPNTAQERELMDLVSELQTKLNVFYAEQAKIEDSAQQYTHFSQHFPAREFGPKLLAFEERHRGTYAGLMALHSVASLAAGSHEDGPHYSSRREAMKRLPIYAPQVELVTFLKNVTYGRFDSQGEQLFRTLSESKEADPMVQEYSKLMLAQWLLAWKHARESSERRLKELDNGAEPDFPRERQFYIDRLAVLPTAVQTQGWDKEAVGLLQMISKSTSGLRQPAIQSVDQQWWLLRLDVERTKSMPLLSEVADRLLFKELHLQIGKAAPDFQVRLVSGKDWSLSAQEGRVVIIQFSFKGCGPCERMYPDLQRIQQEYGPKVSILSIMADEHQSVTDETVKSGKLTWDVHWDGLRGPLATRWGVNFHPTVYVLDSKGFVANGGYDLTGKPLKQTVAELVKAAELSKEPPR